MERNALTLMFMHMPRRRATPNLRRCAALWAVLAGLGTLAGCQPGQTVQLWPAPATKPAAPAAPPDPVDNPFLVRLTPSTPTISPGVSQRAVQFRVMRVQAPLGAFSRSQKIWDHLDEQAVGIETQVILQRNGLRIGLGTPESWPPVHAILETVENRTVKVLPPSLPNSLSVPLQLNNEPIDETILFYRPDGSLSGESFVGATDVLRITWEFYSDNIENVAVYITPEIRQDASGHTFRAMPNGTVAIVPVYEGRVFREVACRLVVPPDGYIVLGPSADVGHAGLLGRQFLVKSIDGELYEDLLVIVPEVVDLSQQAAAPEAETTTR